MNIWMWLIIGFLTGLVVAAIINLISKGRSSAESQQMPSDESAKLAKAEVKIAVLEDKLRQADADRMALRASLEADCEDKLAAAEADYRVQLAILESEKVKTSVAASKAELEKEAALLDSDSEADFVETDSQSVESIIDDEDWEDVVIVEDSQEVVNDAPPFEFDEEDESARNTAVAAVLIAAAVVGETEEEGDTDEFDSQLLPDEDSGTDSLLVEELTVEFASDVVENHEEVSETEDNAQSPVETAEEDLEITVDDSEEEDLNSIDGSLAAMAMGAAAIGAVVREDSEDETEIESEDDEPLDERLPVSVIEGSEERELETDELTANDTDADLHKPQDELEELPVAVVSDLHNMQMETIDAQVVDEPEDGTDEDALLRTAVEATVGTAAISAVVIDDDAVNETVIESEEHAEDETDLDDEKKESNREAVDVDPVVPEWPEDHSMWQGEYFNNMKLEGEPVLVREDHEINFDWGFGSPSPEINIDNFSVRWTRKADFPPGLYRFTVMSDDGVRLWVNERLVISAWYDHSQMTFRREMELPGGAVNLRLEYYENDMAALIKCYWERIG